MKKLIAAISLAAFLGLNLPALADEAAAGAADAGKPAAGDTAKPAKKHKAKKHKAKHKKKAEGTEPAAGGAPAEGAK